MLETKANEIRKLTIEEIGRLSVGHIGGSVDLCELLAVLYFHAMHIDPQDPRLPERDRFVLSKGHGGPALYATLALRGYFPLEKLQTLNRPGTDLPSHCDMNRTPGIDMTTGSLGQGFSCAVGMALGARMEHLPSTIFACIGDGESQEGQVWEGALYAPQHKLSHLIAFLDYNHQQLDGYTKDICDLGDMRQKFQDFGWYALEVDGHDVDAIYDAIALAKHQQEKPTMIVLQTQKGKGCFFAEGIKYNHHMRFSKEQCEEAIARLEKEGC